jgi:hypothetical protein
VGSPIRDGCTGAVVAALTLCVSPNARWTTSRAPEPAAANGDRCAAQHTALRTDQAFK